VRNTQEIEIEKIELDGNIRSEPTEEGVRRIKNSIPPRVEKSLPPLINPISVEKINGTYKLISGKQRLLAMIDLGYKTIEAFVFKNHPMKDWESHDENRASNDLSWYDYAKFYKHKNEEGMTQTDIGKRADLSQISIGKMIRAYEVCEIFGTEYLMRHPYPTIYEMSLAPREDWDKIVKLIVNKNFSDKKVRAVVNETKEIRDMILTIEDEKKQTWARNQIEPLLYTENMNKLIAMDIILRARGLYMETPEVVFHLSDMIKRMKKFSETYTKNSEYKEWEEDGILKFQLTGWIKSEMLEVGK